MAKPKLTKKLFTVTKKDLVVQTFRAGGKGGQNQNKRDTGVRIIHPDSGAVGISREERSQIQNKRRALQRLADSKEFNVWVRLKAAQAQGKLVDLDKEVDDLMCPTNLRVETRKPGGKWTRID